MGEDQEPRIPQANLLRISAGQKAPDVPATASEELALACPLRLLPQGEEPEKAGSRSGRLPPSPLAVSQESRPCCVAESAQPPIGQEPPGLDERVEPPSQPLAPRRPS